MPSNSPYYLVGCGHLQRLPALLLPDAVAHVLSQVAAGEVHALAGVHDHLPAVEHHVLVLRRYAWGGAERAEVSDYREEMEDSLT